MKKKRNINGVYASIDLLNEIQGNKEKKHINKQTNQLVQ